MNRKLSYFLGDTYSKDMYSYLKNIMAPAFQLQEYCTDGKSQICIVSPSVNQKELEILKNQSPILILDFCHFDFLDLNNYIKILEPSIIVSPIEIGETSILKSSLNLLKTRKETNLSKARNDEAILFCSQPLEEDNRGISQNEFIKELIECTDREVVVKRHPREKHTASSSNVTTFNGTIHRALETYSNWVGFNSMALYSARSLNHNVFMIKEDYPGHLEELKKFTSSKLSNFNISPVIHSEQNFLKEFFELIHRNGC